ncbi:MAG: hypothetical protein ACREXU_02225 [Gammaproteobacteria bacterium]
MARLVLPFVGGVVGNLIAPGIGGSIGFALGGLLGNLIDPVDKPRTEGPRLNDLSVQSSTEGAAIPIVYGAGRFAGNVIWALPIKETQHEDDVDGGGGKGLGGGGATQVSYTYSASFAVGLCEGPVGGVRRIWADSKLIYDTRGTGVTNHPGLQLRIYTDTETQAVDPLIEATELTANTPAFRGLCYLVIEDLPLADFANHIPNLSAEVVKVASDAYLKVVEDSSFGTGTNTSEPVMWYSPDGAFLYYVDINADKVIKVRTFSADAARPRGGTEQAFRRRGHDGVS